MSHEQFFFKLAVSEIIYPNDGSSLDKARDRLVGWIAKDCDTLAEFLERGDQYIDSLVDGINNVYVPEVESSDEYEPDWRMDEARAEQLKEARDELISNLHMIARWVELVDREKFRKLLIEDWEEIHDAGEEEAK